LLLHMIISHHGELAYGSPKVPLFPEAMLLHHLDNLDSKMECMRGLLERDRQVEGVWTGYSSALDRALLKKSKFLEPAVEAVPAMTVPAGRGAIEQKRPPEPTASPFASKLKDALKD
jgi:3'-5' exoribonuclease